MAQDKEPNRLNCRRFSALEWLVPERMPNYRALYGALGVEGGPTRLTCAAFSENETLLGGFQG